MDDVITSTGNINYDSVQDKSKYFYFKIVIVIIILAIFGFNIFTNLGYITDEIAFITEPIIALFAKITGKTTKTAVKTTTAGTREVSELVDETADAIDDTISNVANKNINIKNLSDNLPKNLSNNLGQDYEKPTVNTIPEPDDSNSEVQQGTTGKKGFCYIGNWNGFRSCVKVSESTKCLSGMTYDTEQMCRNPELRN
tara:strand:+ start:663 stop:1256 length:594 start_codon:yes stop_codon:yes gene_type:complete